MKYGLVDIGSNTIRMVMYRIYNGKIEHLLNSKIIGRLVDYVEDDIMKVDGAKVLIDAINTHKELASHHALDHITYFATASLRVKNADEVLAAVREGTGEHINVLSSEQEAKCGVDGIAYDFNLSNCICLDLGGGSLEVTLVRDGQITNSVSLPIGSVSLTKKYVTHIFPSKEEIESIRAEVIRHLRQIDWLNCDQFDVAYAVGGSARAMAKVHTIFDNSDQDLHGYRVFSSDISGLYERLIKMELDGIRLIDQYCSGRLFSAIPGMIVYDTVLSYTNIPMIRMSRNGVREGYLINNIINK